MVSPATPRSKGTGKYSTPTIQILVGDQAEAFYVHYTALEKTSFFDIHGFPARAETPGSSPSHPATPVHSPALSDDTLAPAVKIENSDNGMMDNSDATSALPTQIATNTYSLKGSIYEPEAFLVIINYLYNERPSTPNVRAGLRTLRKAYVLALQYRMEGLQDDIVNCFRNFHSKYTIQFEDLTWLTNRIGGDELSMCRVPMIQYLLEQCAYEIYYHGYDMFISQNVGFEPFLVDGDHPMRKELFKAMVKIAAVENPTDPARGSNLWRARDWAQYDPSTTQSNVEIIDIDD